MSSHMENLAHHGHGGHGHGGGHDHHDDDDGAGHGTLKSYVTGFILAAILTAIPFWLVMDRVFANSRTTALVILALSLIHI